MKELTCSEIEEQALIERYVAGRLSDDGVEAFESHYLTCPRCLGELRLALAIREALPEMAESDTRLRVIRGGAGDHDQSGHAAGQPAAPAGPGRSRRFKVGTAAAMATAAVLAGLLFLRPVQLTDDLAPVHRDDASSAESALMPRTPIGDVPAVREFRWSPQASADLYHVTLYDEEGAAIWEVETSEPRAVIPEGTRLEPGASYLWEVAARVDWNRWVRSELVRFEIHEP